MCRSLICLFLVLAVPIRSAVASPGRQLSAASQAAAGNVSTVLRGRVMDPMQNPIVGAQVIVAHERSRTFEATTDAHGAFAVAVPPGSCVITVTAPAFVAASRRVSAGQPTDPPIEFTLQVEGVRETVDVNAPGHYRVPALTSATRTPTPARDVPQSISVVSRDLIADQRMSSMADVVRYMPGVGIAQGEGNRDTPIIRGNASTSDFFVDGVRDDVQYLRDVYNSERIEALKGPNAMIFGRGGGGGVINRVTRQAGWGESREASLQVGSWDNRRVTVDAGHAPSERVAIRTSGLYESADSYRSGVDGERYGINPTVAVRLGTSTLFRAGYEYFHDDRTADRGVSSFNGRPVTTDPGTFFGDPAQSRAEATINVLSSVVEHGMGAGITIRNRFSYGNYDKFYQNVFPGAVNATATTVSMSAYNNATTRQNLFNQADLIVARRTGRVGHTFLVGAELGRQETDNFRQTGYFIGVGPTVTTITAPLQTPTISVPLEFRQNATDADNHGVATTAAVYAQDQIALSRQFEAVVGLRFDSFEMDFRNNRTQTDFRSADGLLSPRLGLVYKPVVPVSIYGSYSLSYLPRAGEQLNSLSLNNQALDPEEFKNYELGAKWDIAPAVSFTAAVYRLDRGNVAVADPNDPAVSILVDAQRTEGLELGLNGNLTRAWSVAGGYAYQAGEITRSISATAVAGATLAQLPAHSFSLWNKYDVTAKIGLALGIIHRSEVFTSTDNLVLLPGYTRIDAGAFFTLNARFRAQLNVENLFDEEYYANAHSNTNITPGSPRAVRLAITTRF
jgi:catecholate siderophore receptor